MVNSMTGFAARTGQNDTFRWSWDLRSLNGKGLDQRIRVPDWVEGLEAALRARIAKSLKRGSVSVGLRLNRESTEGDIHIDGDALMTAMSWLRDVEGAAGASGVTLAPTSAADVLAMRNVLSQNEPETDTAALKQELLQDFEPLLTEFLEMRAREGQALDAILTGHVDRIAALREAAIEALPDRAENAQRALRDALARVVENADGVDDARVAQELAVLAVKGDVTEELDRLSAHVVAARDLLVEEGPVGRKLEFLMQEFNREANTLCSKSQDATLTRIGLDLKAVIDQMREQVLNVE